MAEKDLKDISKRPDFKEITAKGGRNKKGKLHMTTILKNILKQKKKIVDPITGKEKRKTIAEIIAIKAVQNAIKGDNRAIQDVFERIDGKVAQKVDQTHSFKTMPKVIIDGKELKVLVGEEPDESE